MWGFRTSPRCTGSGCPDLASAVLSTCRLRDCTKARDNSLRHFFATDTVCRETEKTTADDPSNKVLRTVMYLGQLPAQQVGKCHLKVWHLVHSVQMYVPVSLADRCTVRSVMR
jgi:hypothetical protein